MDNSNNDDKINDTYINRLYYRFYDFIQNINYNNFIIQIILIIGMCYIITTIISIFKININYSL